MTERQIFWDSKIDLLSKINVLFYRPNSENEVRLKQQRQPKNIEGAGHYQDVQDISQLNDMSFSIVEEEHTDPTWKSETSRLPQMDSK